VLAIAAADRAVIGRVLFTLTALLVGAGLYLTGEAAWIRTKAKLAQYLIAEAWEETQAGVVGARPWPWADMTPLAILEAPGQRIRQVVLSGASGRNLAFGPNHIDASARPDALGTVVLAGHRDTHFAFLESIQQGEKLTLTDRSGTRRDFRVESLEVAGPRTTDLRLGDGTSLVLVTCYPFDAIDAGGPLRYVVTAVVDGPA
jgi:sortase A